MAGVDAKDSKRALSLSGAEASKVLAKSQEKEKRKLQRAAAVGAQKQESLKNASSSSSSSGGSSGHGKKPSPDTRPKIHIDSDFFLDYTTSESQTSIASRRQS